MGAKVVAACAFHPGVRAVTRCARCGAMICAGCARVVGKRRFCEGCYARQFGLGDRGRAAEQESAMDRAPWGLWPAMAYLPLPFILSGIMTWLMRRGGDISVGAAEFLLSALLYSTMLFFAFFVVSRYGSVTAEIGFSARNLPSSLGTGLVGGALTFWASVAAAALSNAIFGSLGELERWMRGFMDINVKNVTGVDILIVGLIVVVAAPICEEIFFRGYLYPAMRNRMGVWGAAFLNGFIFSAAHISLFGLIGRTLAGALFCLLYEYNDNLWSPITAHAVNNFVAFFLPVLIVTAS